MKLLSAALAAILVPGLAAALPTDSSDPRSGGLRSSSSIHRGTRETSDGAVEPDYMYWNAPIKNVELTCIDNSIRAGGGKPLYTCIREGEALCIEYEKNPPMGGKWAFGVKDSMVKLWNPKMEVVWEFCTEATHVCVGEVHGYVPNRYSKERPYLYFYNEKTHQTVGNLTCDGTDGKDGKNLGESTILKLVDNSHLGQYVQYPIDIVKFKKGMTPDPTDDNSLWNITYNPTDPQRLWWDSTQDFDATYSYNEDKCEWTDLCPSNAPSDAPSNVPSASPTDFCPSGFVECCKGHVAPCLPSGEANSTAPTCAVECNGECCTGTDACNGFTGNVCKDGSCGGENACLNATIGEVVNGCKNDGGSNACNGAGSNGGDTGENEGTIGLVKDSCIGPSACFLMAIKGGQIDTIIGSCKGNGSCLGAALDGGSIDLIEDSCFGEDACWNAAATNGRIGSITNGSCDGQNACLEAARNNGNISSISSGCIGGGSPNTCNRAGKDGGTIGSIIDGCFGLSACLNTALRGGQVGTIIRSCRGPGSCFSTALNGGSIDLIEDSCLKKDACSNTATTDGRIVSITNGSCDGQNACRETARNNGVISSINNGCIGEGGPNTCFRAGWNGGTIGAVRDSCRGEDACSEMASEGGSIGDVSFSCIGTNACSDVAESDGDVAVLNGSCLDNNSCAAYGSPGPSPAPGLTCVVESFGATPSASTVQCINSGGAESFCDGTTAACT